MFRALRPVLFCLVAAVPAVALRLTGVHPSAPLGDRRLRSRRGRRVVRAGLGRGGRRGRHLRRSGDRAAGGDRRTAGVRRGPLLRAHGRQPTRSTSQYAAANMTGSNRLLLGLGWSSVVLVSLYVASRRSGRTVKALVLESGYRRELGFLAIASVVAFVIPVTGQIHLRARHRAARLLRLLPLARGRLRARRRAGPDRAGRADRRPADGAAADRGDRRCSWSRPA